MTSNIELIERVEPFDTSHNDQSQPKLLLIEHDNYLKNALMANVSESAYQITNIPTGSSHRAELKDYLDKHSPDMIVLDIGFTQRKELLIMRDIRTLYHGLLIIVSSQNCEEEQVSAFKLGADDFLAKPIDSRILKMRIAALLRRKNEKTNPVELASLTLGDVCLQPKSQKCFINGDVVKLTTFEFNLLKLLLERQGQIVSRDQLYHGLLNRPYNGVERTLDVRMSQLREKLTSAGMKVNQIETIWGQGYMLNNTRA
jgi:DNA-binding response OmpR family regulator